MLSQIAPATVLDYWDFQARAAYDLTPDDRVSVFAYGAYDYLGQHTPTEEITVTLEIRSIPWWRRSPSRLLRHRHRHRHVDTSTLSPAAERTAAAFPSRSDLSMGIRGDVSLDPLPGFRITPCRSRLRAGSWCVFLLCPLYGQNGRRTGSFLDRGVYAKEDHDEHHDYRL